MIDIIDEVKASYEWETRCLPISIEYEPALHHCVTFCAGFNLHSLDLVVGAYVSDERTSQTC